MEKDKAPKKATVYVIEAIYEDNLKEGEFPHLVELSGPFTTMKHATNYVVKHGELFTEGKYRIVSVRRTFKVEPTVRIKNI